MASQVGQELNDGDLVHPVFYWQTEEEPDRRNENQQEEETQHPGITPVQGALPYLLHLKKQIKDSFHYRTE